jgi:hypothetical protein
MSQAYKKNANSFRDMTEYETTLRFSCVMTDNSPRVLVYVGIST